MDGVGLRISPGVVQLLGPVWMRGVVMGNLSSMMMASVKAFRKLRDHWHLMVREDIEEMATFSREVQTAVKTSLKEKWNTRMLECGPAVDDAASGGALPRPSRDVAEDVVKNMMERAERWAPNGKEVDSEVHKEVIRLLENAGSVEALAALPPSWMAFV